MSKTDSKEESTTDLVPVETGGVFDLEPMVDVEIWQERLNKFRAFVQQNMKKDEDYGTIPGVPKPFLFKAGAEKLGNLYGLAPKLEIQKQVEDFSIDPPLFFYVVKCMLTHIRTGAFVAEGIGSCNSREKKYRYLKSDTPEAANTILKMAKKRAHVDAMLTATRASGSFTQDEDAVKRAKGVKGATDPYEDKPIETTAEPVDPEPPADGGKLVNPAKAKQLEARLVALNDEEKAWAIRKMVGGDKYKPIVEFTKDKARALEKALDDNPPTKRVAAGDEYHVGDGCGNIHCPGKMELRPAGKSKKTGKPYKAFLGCSEWRSGCKFASDVPKE